MSVNLPSSYTDTDRTTCEEMGIEQVLLNLETYDPSVDYGVDLGDMLCYLAENNVLPILTDPDLALDASFINTVEDLRQLNLVNAENDTNVAALVAQLTAFLSDSGNPISVYEDAQSFIDDWNARNPDYATTGAQGSDDSDATAESTTLTADDLSSYWLHTGNLAMAILFLLNGGDVEDEDGNTTHKDGLFVTINDGLDAALESYELVQEDVQKQNELIESLDMTEEDSQIKMKLADTALSNDKTQTDLLTNQLKTLQDIPNTLLQLASDDIQSRSRLNSQINS